MANQHNFPLIGQAFLGTKILSASATLAGTDSGKGFSNASAPGSITVTLPQAKPGYQFQFLEVVAHNIVVTPQSTDNIRGLSAGTAVTLSAVGALLYLECINAGTWEIVQSLPVATGVTQIVAGTNITISPVGGTGAVTINSTAAGGVTSITGTANEIAASASTGAVTLSFPANVVIPAPTTGVAFTANAVAGKYAGVFNGVTGGQSGVQIISGAASTDIAFEVATVANNYFLVWGDGHIELGSNVGSGTQGLAIGTAGNVVINTPLVTTACPLTVTGPSAAQIGIFNGSAGNCYFDFKVAGSIIGRIGTADSIVVGGTAGDFSVSCTGGALNFATGGSVSRMVISSAGLVTIAGLPVAQTGSFTATYVGGTTAPTVTVAWTKTGNSVTFSIPNVATTSNSTSFSLSGIPSGLFSTTANKIGGVTTMAENNTITGNIAQVSTSTTGSFQFTLSGSNTLGGGWTAAGTKGFIVPICITVDVT